MTPRSTPYTTTIWSLFPLAALTLLTACPSGGGSSGGILAGGFSLQSMGYGRQFDEGSGPRVVSPLTTVRIDPITGFAIPGTLEPLCPLPPVAPR